MAIELVKQTKNTRGRDSREITFPVIGKYVTKTIEKESKPVIDEETKKIKLDANGDEVWEELGKDAEGKQIIYKHEVQELEVDGVIPDTDEAVADALALVGGSRREFLDCFAAGFNYRSERREADKDELDPYVVELKLNDEEAKAFKRTARQLAKNPSLGLELNEAAEYMKMNILKNRAKAEAEAAKTQETANA